MDIITSDINVQGIHPADISFRLSNCGSDDISESEIWVLTITATERPTEENPELYRRPIIEFKIFATEGASLNDWEACALEMVKTVMAQKASNDHSMEKLKSVQDLPF